MQFKVNDSILTAEEVQIIAPETRLTRRSRTRRYRIKIIRDGQILSLLLNWDDCKLPSKMGQGLDVEDNIDTSDIIEIADNSQGDDSENGTGGNGPTNGFISFESNTAETAISLFDKGKAVSLCPPEEADSSRFSCNTHSRQLVTEQNNFMQRSVTENRIIGEVMEISRGLSEARDAASSLVDEHVAYRDWCIGMLTDCNSRSKLAMRTIKCSIDTSRGFWMKIALRFWRRRAARRMLRHVFGCLRAENGSDGYLGEKAWKDEMGKIA